MKKTFDFLIIFFSIFLKYASFTFNISKIYIYIFFIFLLLITLLTIKDYHSTKKDFLILVIILSLALYLSLISSGIDFIMPLLLAFYFRNENYKTVLKYILIASIICFSSTLILRYFGIIRDKFLSRNFNGDIVYRYSLGFEHVNSAYLHFFIISMLLYIFLNNKYIYSILTFSISCFIYFNTYCRTGFLCSILFIVFILLIPNKIKNKLSNNTDKFFVILTIISFLLAFIFGRNTNLVDTLVSNRFQYWLLNIKTYNLINFSGVSSIYFLDNLFLGLIYNYGIFSYIFYLILYFLGVKNIKDEKLKFTLLFFLIYGLFENNHTYYINYSTFILMYYIISSNAKFKGEKYE